MQMITTLSVTGDARGVHIKNWNRTV